MMMLSGIPVWACRCAECGGMDIAKQGESGFRNADLPAGDNGGRRTITIGGYYG